MTNPTAKAPKLPSILPTAPLVGLGDDTTDATPVPLAVEMAAFPALDPVAGTAVGVETTPVVAPDVPV